MRNPQQKLFSNHNYVTLVLVMCSPTSDFLSLKSDCEQLKLCTGVEQLKFYE